ncbi:LiaF transmembrane domain-containing protein [Halobaculum sp. D14]|uniref:LiaF transmembrane domain-containing protein n=1 Tax=unclassified Halobaculum TaxID=2640896 RepID=UPI003EBC9BEA
MTDTSSDTSAVTAARRPRTHRILGGLVVALGVLLLADTTGLVAVDGFDVFLAAALVVYGGYRLVSERAEHLFWPGAALLVGAGWLLVEFDVLTGGQARQLWPLLLVLFGASLLRGRRHGRGFGSDVVVGTGGRVGDASSVTAVFEDARLDLRGLDIPTPAAVEAVAVFGDAEVVVPEDWVVVTDATAVFGSVRDMRRARPTGDPDLVLDGAAIFGDVRLTD